MRIATLHGSPLVPVISMSTNPRQRHPITGQSLEQWAASLPGSRRDRETGTWMVTDPGPHVSRIFEDAGYTLDLLRAPDRLSELYRPVVELVSPREVHVYPRFSGRRNVARVLSSRAAWDELERRFTAPVEDVADWPARLLSEEIQAAARRGGLDEASRRTSAAASEAGLEDDVSALVARFGDVPEWFGRTPYPYQRIGALSVAAGRRLLADAPGLGKSLQAILAAALLRSEKVIVVCPPVVQSNWVREIEMTSIVEHMGEEAQIVSIRPGRKEPEMPVRGFVVITDSLLSSREMLAERLGHWEADLLIYDEAHRAKTWEAKRSVAMRKLAATVTDRVALSGTPMMSNPAELPSLLSITGQLQPIFGSRKAFMSRYTREVPITVGRRTVKKIVPNRASLPELGQRLRDDVWVRRTKDQVLPDLPSKVRSIRLVDVPLAQYREAHREIEQKVIEHLREMTARTGSFPTDEDLKEWSKDRIEFVSKLRRAAGVCKVDVASEYITDWLDQTAQETGNGEVEYTRPLIVWGVHVDVLDALAAKLAEEGVRFAMLRGDTKDTERDRIVDDVQEGRVGVLLANIVAAGVGITLARASDELFVETEWLPDLVTQAEDRCHRIGQTNPVNIVTLVAEGTLDNTIHRVLRRNIEVLDAVMGGESHHVAADDDIVRSRSVSGVLADIVEVAAEKERRACEVELKAMR